MLDEYFEYVSGRIKNTVTKVAQTLLVKKVVKNVQTQLSLGLKDTKEEWSEEKPDIADIRHETNNKVKVRYHAINVGLASCSFLISCSVNTSAPWRQH